MRFELYTDVALTRDMPELALRRGDLVKVVDHHVAPVGEEGYSIECLMPLARRSPSPPCHSASGLPVYVARVPATPFCKTLRYRIGVSSSPPRDGLAAAS
jgi:hypothetical protein